MAESHLKTRIVHKHDIEVNWLKAVNFIPMQAEIIVYDIEVDASGNTLALPEGRTEPYTYERFKIGDGKTLVSDLPFAAAPVDATLTQEGRPADAKAVGDKFANYITSEAATAQDAVILSEAQSYTDNAIASIDVPEVDLTGYATEEYVNTALSKVSVEVDASLSEAGKAADSHAVGEAFMKLFNETTVEGESVGETLTWDGKIDGRMFTEKELAIPGEGSVVATYVHVSNNVPTYDQLVNGFTYKWVYSEGDRTQVNTRTYTPDTIELEETDACIKLNHLDYTLILGDPIFVKRPFVNSTGHVFNLPGIYFYVVSSRVITDSRYTGFSYTTSLTIPGYNFTTSNRTISKLKNEYLPYEVETLINKVDATADIYLAMPSAIEGLGGVHTLDEVTSATLGATITSNVYVVKSLLTQLKPSFDGDYVMNVYVVDDTGIGYVSMNGLVMSLSDVLEESLGQEEFTGAYNKGWISDINAVDPETAPGVYCIRKDELFDLPTQYIGDTLTVPDTLDESKLIKILDIPDTTPPAAYYALKLSDSVPTIDDINRGWSGTGTGGQYPTGSLTNVSDYETYISISDGYEASYGVYIIKEPNVTIAPNSSPISEPGVYAPVLSAGDELGCGVKTFTIPGYNFLSTEEGNKTIKPELLPEVAISRQISTTHSELVTLRNNSQLLPGMFYRITDYVCTTSQADTRAVDNKFDIIVQALSTNTLSENAGADYCSVANDAGYFDAANLSAWELKYCLDNNTTRFAWADEEGKGVIYYMKDEHSNECPYDFKNITFVFDATESYTFSTNNSSDLSMTNAAHDNKLEPLRVGNIQTLNRVPIKSTSEINNVTVISGIRDRMLDISEVSTPAVYRPSGCTEVILD